jgi:hypothetical protein
MKVLNSALSDPNRNQGGLHEASAAVVVIGIETQPNHQSEHHKHQACEN